MLQGRSLPYKPVAWGRTQRRDKNWMPGGPVATMQVLGPTVKDTTVTGKWKDSKIWDDANAARLINFPALSGQTRVDRTERTGDGGATFVSGGSMTPDQRGRRARVLRDAFDKLCLEGQLVEVSWGSISRVGLLKETNYPHDQEEDIAFELVFDFVGTTDAQRIPISTGFDGVNSLRSFLSKLNGFLDRILNELATAAFRAEDFVRRVSAQINKLGSFVVELVNTMERFVTIEFAPADLAGTIRQNLRAIRLAAIDLVSEIDRESAVIKASFSGDPNQVNAAMAFEQAIRASAERFAGEAADQERQIALTQAPSLLGTMVSPGGITFRDISTRYYGTPDNAGELQRFNNLTVSLIPRGLIIKVPRL